MPACRSLIDSCPLLFESTFAIENTAWLETICSAKRGKVAQSLEGSSESSLLVALPNACSVGDFSNVLPGLFYRRHFRHTAEYIKNITSLFI